MKDLDGFESWIYFGSKYGCNLNILLYSFVFHFQIDFVLHIDEENFIRIQDLVIKFEFDFYAHKIDGCYIFNIHHKNYILK